MNIKTLALWSEGFLSALGTGPSVDNAELAVGGAAAPWLRKTFPDPKRQTRPFRPYGSNVPRTVPFLTGSSQGLALNAKSLNAPPTASSASANRRL